MTCEVASIGGAGAEVRTGGGRVDDIMNEELESYFFSEASLKPPGALQSDVRTADYERRRL